MTLPLAVRSVHCAQDRARRSPWRLRGAERPSANGWFQAAPGCCKLEDPATNELSDLPSYATEMSGAKRGTSNERPDFALGV